MDEDINEFDILVIDADSLMYKLAYVYATPNQMHKALDTRIQEIIDRVGADEVHCIIKGTDNFRYQCDPEYKGNRADTIEPEIKDRINKLYEYAKTFCVQADGCEADDICSIIAHEGIEEGKRVCVAHIDKDLDCIPGYHFNYNKNTMYFVHPADAYRFMMLQCLAGDATDNIKGLKGVGLKTAEKLVGNTTNFNLWKKVIAIWTERFGEGWKEEFVKCANCIVLRMKTADLRPLTYEELEDRLKWDVELKILRETTDTGSPSQNDQPTPLDSSTPSSDQPDGNTSEESN